MYESLDEETKPAYFELVYMLCLMQTNLNELYVSCEYPSYFAFLEAVVPHLEVLGRTGRLTHLPSGPLYLVRRSGSDRYQRLRSQGFRPL